MKQDNEPALPLWLVLLCFLVALLGANYVCGRPFRWAGKGAPR